MKDTKTSRNGIQIQGLMYITKLPIYSAPKGTRVIIYKSSQGVETLISYGESTMRAIWACFILYREMFFKYIDDKTDEKRAKYEMAMSKCKHLADGCLSTNFENSIKRIKHAKVFYLSQRGIEILKNGGEVEFKEEGDNDQWWVFRNSNSELWGNIK